MSIRLSRRDWLAAAAALTVSPFARADDAPALIVRNSRPLDLETPVTFLDRVYTPNDAFFVRSHFDVPAVPAGPWTIRVGGTVESPRSLTLKDLEALPRVELPAVLQCSGNGRAFFRPRMPGVAWERGAVGQAMWSGVRLGDVLGKAGLKREARHLHILGADLPPHIKTPAFLRSIPIERALHQDTLLATHMNGVPLPLVHGGPVRLVVPTWSGNNWLKWITSLTASPVEAHGFYMQTGYRIPRNPVPPGTNPPPSELVPVTLMNVKSLIARPAPGAKLAPDDCREAVGVAWTGSGTIAKVEIRIDDAPWRPAALEGPDRPGAWRVWKLPLQLKPGRHTILARAADSTGAVQPESTPWNKSGYHWNGIERVEFEVAHHA